MVCTECIQEWAVAAEAEDEEVEAAGPRASARTNAGRSWGMPGWRPRSWGTREGEFQDAELEAAEPEAVEPEAVADTVGRMGPVEPHTLEACTRWQVVGPVQGMKAVGRMETQTRSVGGALGWCPLERPPGRCRPQP